ncbi:polyprotein [Phytophthora megakarya]|uniref:Polyprotein n=1 Tax=Phytophthora megakarya TaxID=4795 RepID=A0A225W600_9STRA|nr:polyprotein [Phytophthora megakarya]
MQLGGCAVTYFCKSQRTVALSSTVAEYMALAHGIKEVIFSTELGKVQGQAIVNVDNQSASAVASNTVQHSRMQHIDMRYHFVRERIAAEEIATEYVNTKDNIADLLTTAVSNDVTESLRAKLGVKAIGQRVSDVPRDQARKSKRKRE